MTIYPKRLYIHLHKNIDGPKKKVLTLFLAFFVISTICLVSNVSASTDEATNSTSTDEITAYEIGDLFDPLGKKSGSVGLQCYDGGSSTAVCDITYTLVGDFISNVSATVNIYDSDGDVQATKDSNFRVGGLTKAYDQIEAVVLAPDTFRAVISGYVYGGKGAYKINNIYAKPFSVK